MHLADLTTGRQKWSAPAAVGDPKVDADVTTFVTGFAITPKGSAVWIGVFSAGGETNEVDSPLDQVEVRKLEAGSPKDGTQVDQGQDVKPGSLALDRHVFYYAKGTTALSGSIE